MNNKRQDNKKIKQYKRRVGLNCMEALMNKMCKRIYKFLKQMNF